MVSLPGPKDLSCTHSPHRRLICSRGITLVDQPVLPKMSWFNHINQGSNQQQQQPIDSNRLSITDISCNPHYSRLGGPPTMTTQVSSLRLENFPSALKGVACPPSLEILSCASPNAGQAKEPEPISYVSLQEQRCVLSWFQGWTAAQRERFLQDLLGKAVPGKVCTLLDSLSTLQVLALPCSYPGVDDMLFLTFNNFVLFHPGKVKDRLPNIFECQLRLWTQWFESWGEEERNHFLHILEERDPTFVAHFYRNVAGTAGRD